MIMKHACHFRIIRTRSFKVFLKVKLFLSANERRKWRGDLAPLMLNIGIRLCGHFHSPTALRSVSI
jgi:hypothetical protein